MYLGPAWSVILEGSESDNQMLTLVSYDGEVYGHHRNMPVRIPRLLSERPFEYWATVPIIERREAELFRKRIVEFQKSQALREAIGQGKDIRATVRFGIFYVGFNSNPVPQSLSLKELSRRITKPPFSVKKSFRPSDCELETLLAFLKSEGFEEYEKNTCTYLCTVRDCEKSTIVEFDHNLEGSRISTPIEKLFICDLVRLKSPDSERGKPSKPDIRILLRSSHNVKPEFEKSADTPPILEFAPAQDSSADQASAEPIQKIKLHKNYRKDQGKLVYTRQKQVTKYKIKDAASPTSEFRRKVEVHVSVVKNYELGLDGLVSTGILEHQVIVELRVFPSPEQEAEWKEISFALLEFAFKLGDELRVVQQTETPQLQS